MCGCPSVSTLQCSYKPLHPWEPKQLIDLREPPAGNEVPTALACCLYNWCCAPAWYRERACQLQFSFSLFSGREEGNIEGMSVEADRRIKVVYM